MRKLKSKISKHIKDLGSYIKSNLNSFKENDIELIFQGNKEV